jgi:hypothetical protein
MVVGFRAGFTMLMRVASVLVVFLATAPAVAEQLDPDAARRFVVGKMFAYNCFEGTRGVGRIHGDGSVVGSIQFQGKGPVRFARLPAGTLQVKNGTVCATVRGMPFEPCFNLNKTSHQSFRGSVYGLGFAYCDFTRHGVARSAWHLRRSQPLSIHSAAAGN